MFLKFELALLNNAWFQHPSGNHWRCSRDGFPQNGRFCFAVDELATGGAEWKRWRCTSQTVWLERQTRNGSTSTVTIPEVTIAKVDFLHHRMDSNKINIPVTSQWSEWKVVTPANVFVARSLIKRLFRFFFSWFSDFTDSEETPRANGDVSIDVTTEDVFCDELGMRVKLTLGSSNGLYQLIVVQGQNKGDFYSSTKL